MDKKKCVLSLLVLFSLMFGHNAYAGYGLTKVSVRNRNFNIDYANYGFMVDTIRLLKSCLLYTSPSPRDVEESRMPSSA